MAKILFIEDEMHFQEVLIIKLKAEGYEVFSAADGESGIKMAKETAPDLILLDLILPKKDGFEVLDFLKTDQGLNAIPVIEFTNLEGRRDVEKALALGVRLYLVKANYTLQEIVQKIGEVLKESFNL